MLYLKLRSTGRGSLCRLTTDTIGVMSVVMYTHRRYKSSHEEQQEEEREKNLIGRRELEKSDDEKKRSNAADDIRHVSDYSAVMQENNKELPLRWSHMKKTSSSVVYPRVRVTVQQRPTQSEEEREVVKEGEKEGGKDFFGTTDVDDDTLMRSAKREENKENNEVQSFLHEKQRELEELQLERNAAIPYPTHPDDMAPEFHRIKRHQSIIVVSKDADDPSFDRRDYFTQLPPPAMHPWVKNTPIGPFIIHGDGQIGMVGSGEVDFDSEDVRGKLPYSFRGLHHRSVLQQRLPEKNGKVIQDAVVKNSFTLTGRGVFATRDILAGETIMIVRETAHNLGVKGEVERLVEMCSDVLLTVYEAINSTNKKNNEMELNYLHDWIFTGQPSSLLECWPLSATQDVLNRIGGVEVLYALELHEIHIARLAAIIDMNSFLVESSYAVRKGMAYFPEAGFLNHSCSPNATYDVIPEHTFCESDYYLDEAGVDVEETSKTFSSSSPSTPSPASLSSPSGGVTEAEEEKKRGRESITPNRHPLLSHLMAVNDKKINNNNNNVNSDEEDAMEKNNRTKTTTTCHRELAIDSPVQYLFCCRATADIPAGTEILISYIPPEWSFDNRQYVLHDRYRFWCKCPKCAPALDSKYARVPRLIVGMLFFSIFLQMLVFRQHGVDQRTSREDPSSHENNNNNNNNKEEELNKHKKRRERKRGLFEWIEEDKLQDLYALDRLPLPAHMANDPWAKPPR